MRRRLAILLATSLLISLLFSPLGQATLITVDGQPLEEARPILADSRTLVPLRSIFEALDAQVQFDAERKIITATKGSTRVQLTIGSPVVEVDGNPLLIDMPPFVFQGRVYVPLRFVATALGAHVKYYGESDTIIILTEAPPPGPTAGAIQLPPTDLSLAAGNPTQMTEDEFSKALEVIRLVNEERRRQGTPPLTYQNVALFDAAYARAQELPGKFSHTRPDGSKFNTIFPPLKYGLAGENLARNFHSPQSAMEGWLASPGHRSAILDPRFTSTAVGVYSYGGTYYWVEFFLGE